jgi:hypothetical protein
MSDDIDHQLTEHFADNQDSDNLQSDNQTNIQISATRLNYWHIFEWFKAQPLHTNIGYKMTIFLLLLFTYKSKTTTWKKYKYLHPFVLKLYGFFCYA